MSGAYPVGLRLPSEADLASELKVGRSTIREALQHLTGLGVVKSRKGSGAMVLDFRREGTPALLPWYVLAGRFDRPVQALAREMLGLRALFAQEAVRLSVRYADKGGLAEARALLDKAASLEKDPAAHALNELEIFRALVCSSAIWPAVWLANVFWAPIRELHAQLAAAVAHVPADYQREMTKLLDLIEAKREDEADEQLAKWIKKVDRKLLGELERVLGATAGGGERT